MQLFDITELQNGSVWKEPHWVIHSNLPAHAGSTWSTWERIMSRRFLNIPYLHLHCCERIRVIISSLILCFACTANSFGFKMPRKNLYIFKMFLHVIKQRKYKPLVQVQKGEKKEDLERDSSTLQYTTWDGSIFNHMSKSKNYSIIIHHRDISTRSRAEC